MRCFYTDPYHVQPTSDGLELKLPTDGRVILPKDIIVYICLCLPLIFLTVMGFIGKKYVYAVMGGVMLVLMLGVAVMYVRRARKRRELFSFVINEQGVTHVDVDGTYHLSWDQVGAFGLVDDNIISGVRDTAQSARQACLYIAVHTYDEAYLRKRFWRIENRRYMHCSTNEMIVLGFGEDDIEHTLYEEIKPYLYRYCNQSKEVNYTRRRNK